MASTQTRNDKLQSTKQMLDDLDSLMERMLALPVQDADEVPPMDVPHLSTVSATLTMLDGPVYEREEIEDVALAPNYSVDLGAEPDESEELDYRMAPPPLAAPARDLLPPPVMELKLPEEIKVLPRPRFSWNRVALFPLVVVNTLFDGATVAVGPIGRPLRSNAGRNLLGYSGLGLLFVAAGWLVKDWMGWN